MITNLIDFFNHPFFICVGGLTTLLAVIALLCTAFNVAKGLLRFPPFFGQVAKRGF